MVLRDTMRMEMPDRLTDLVYPPALYEVVMNTANNYGPTPVGGDDENVPIDIAESYAGHLSSDAITLEARQGFDHVCCWESIWPERLNVFASRVAQP